MARKHHQYNVAKGCTELQGKYLAMFTERREVTTKEEHQIKPEEKEIIEDLARQYKIRLSQIN